MAKLGENNDLPKAAASVETTLQARRDVAGAQVAGAWISCLFSHKDDASLGDSLTQAAFGAVAIEAIIQRVQIEGKAIPKEVLAALKASELIKPCPASETPFVLTENLARRIGHPLCGSTTSTRELVGQLTKAARTTYKMDVS